MAAAESKKKNKKNSDNNDDEMRPEYDLTKLKFVGRGVYAKRLRSVKTRAERRRRSIK